MIDRRDFTTTLALGLASAGRGGGGAYRRGGAGEFCAAAELVGAE